MSWHRDFAKNYAGKDKLIFNEFYPQIPLVKKLHGYEVRLIPKEMKSPTEISILAHNVIISTTGGDEHFTVVIRNKAVAESFIKYFETMWEISKSA